MYEPWEYVNRQANRGRFGYPGYWIPEDGDQPTDSIRLDLTTLARILQPVVAWQKKYDIPANRIIIEEFGGNRTTKGIDRYFGDLIEIFNQHQWHWLFYSFREDGWDGMDYEIGSRPLGQKYWEAKERGENPTVTRADKPIWLVIKRGLEGQ
jgi:endoglucanase